MSVAATWFTAGLTIVLTVGGCALAMGRINGLLSAKLETLIDEMKRFRERFDQYSDRLHQLDRDVARIRGRIENGAIPSSKTERNR